MKSRVLACMMVTMLFAAAWAQAGTFQPQMVPEGMQWVMHSDLEALRQTSLGAYILDMAKNDMADRKLAAFAAVFGFDPRTDLRSMTVFGKDSTPTGSALIMEGKFDAQRLVTLIRANATCVSNAYGAHVIYGWVDETSGMPKQTYGTIKPDGRIVLAQDEAMVKATLDAMDGKGLNFTQSPGLRDVLPSTSGALLAAAVNMAGMPVNPRAAVLQNAKTVGLSMSIHENTVSGSLSLGSDTVEMATQIEAVSRGMIAFALMSAGTNNTAMAQVAQAFSVARNGNSVVVTMSCPVDNVIRLMEESRAGWEAKWTQPGACAPACDDQSEGTESKASGDDTESGPENNAAGSTTTR